MSEGYEVLNQTAARIDLTPRGRIRVSGDDRARLLHAMCTNHVQNLVPGQGCYAFFLNAVGRILADANILCFEDHLLLDTEPESRSFLMEHLDKYIIADDVVLEDVTPSTFSLGVEGPKAGSVMTVPDAPLSHATADGLTVIRASATGAGGFRLIGPAGSAPGFASLPQASPEDARAVRLENFFPRFGDDISSTSLPQETGITDALHFNKGCYLGQEIVERVRSRGHVNRLLVGLRIEGSEAAARGTKVQFEGTDVGETTSAAWSPRLGATAAMAYLRTNAAKPGTAVLVDGRAAQVTAIKSSRT